ncbi:MAG: DegT/DnrJ/EryC1/StrS family aminotransferase [Verrucomicrobiota bacterium]
MAPGTYQPMFYANKCITTGEGGMACTQRDDYAERMRIMSLHGISKDAWKRFTAQGSGITRSSPPGSNIILRI